MHNQTQQNCKIYSQQTWFCCLASSLLLALHHCEEAGPTMSHHFSSVHNHPEMRCNNSSSVNVSKFRQNISRFFFWAEVSTSVCQGFVQMKSRSLQIRWIVFVETENPFSASARWTFGHVALSSLKSLSQISTIDAFFLFVDRRFSPRRSRIGSSSRTSAAARPNLCLLTVL